jgi:CHAT domain-containing protein
MAELTRWVDSGPGLSVRVSVGGDPKLCLAGLPRSGSSGPTACGEASARIVPHEVLRLAGRAGAVVRTRSDLDALHVVALLDILWADSGGISLGRAIHNLESVAEISDKPGPPLADLAATYLMRAEHLGRPVDLLMGIEAAERALEQDPGNEPANFNLALALSAFGLMTQADSAWRAYLRMDASSAWAARAREQLARVQSAPEITSDTVFVRLGVKDAQQARLDAWDHLLGEWGAALLEGDSARAREVLSRVAILGETLERAGADGTVAEAVRAIVSSVDDAAGIRTLAGGHQRYAAARRKYENGEYVTAERMFVEAAASASGSTSLRRWARLYEGTTRMLNGRPAPGERLLREVLLQSDPLREPALAGHAHWALATTQLRGDQYEPALQSASEAARLLTLAGEREYAGRALGIAAEALFAMGDLDGGYAMAHQAIALLQAYPASSRFHALLFALARRVAGQGITRAAIRVQSEGVEVARRTRNPIHLTEAYLGRARLYAAAGMAALAEVDAAVGRELVLRMTTGPREWFTADLQLTEAYLGVATQTAATVAKLDSVITFFHLANNSLRVFPALIARADAHLALGDRPAALADLERAVAMLGRRRSAISREPLRSAMIDAARTVFDRLVMLRLSEGRVAEALADLDNSRASLALMPPVTRKTERAAIASPPGEILVEYALIGDTLLAWVVSGNRVALAQSHVDTLQLARVVNQVSSSLELRAQESAVGADLALLYDMLIRPIERWLEDDEVPLVIVTEGLISLVPFAALYNTQRGRYLVETRVLRFAVSARDASRPSIPARRARRALLVADPAFDRGAHPGLSRLKGAAAEVQTIATNYSDPLVLKGVEADSTTIVTALHNATVVHYAGHAIFRDDHPELSHLVLAGSRRMRSGMQLFAAGLSELDLRHVDLFVLSACETIRSGGGRAAGFSGLAGALLSAGARGVVAASWRVDDQLTLPLMTALHRVYRAEGHGPSALRTAQLELLRSHDPALRSPAAWAGFRYIGAN